MTLYYDYTTSKKFCEEFGLIWFGDDFPILVEADKAAKAVEMTQHQVDVAMYYHLWEIKYLFNPKSYPFWTRVKLTLYFLTGLRGKKK